MDRREEIWERWRVGVEKDLSKEERKEMEDKREGDGREEKGEEGSL